jgi:LuxR family maltose regulon positive regulatory protein
LEVGDEPSYARELEYILLARYLLAQNMPEKALDLLGRLGTAAKAQARIGSVIQIQVLQALGFQAAGKADQAMKVLAQTLLHAEPDGYSRTFVDEGKPMAALLHSALSRGVTPDYTSRLMASFLCSSRSSPLLRLPFPLHSVSASSKFCACWLLGHPMKRSPGNCQLP